MNSNSRKLLPRSIVVVIARNISTGNLYVNLGLLSSGCRMRRASTRKVRCPIAGKSCFTSN